MTAIGPGSPESGMARKSPSRSTLSIEGDRVSTRLCLFGGPELVRHGRRVSLPEGSKRVLAFVAMHHRPVDRRLVAGTLWPQVGDLRASGNLRTALWRLRATGIDVIVLSSLTLTLQPGIEVDIRQLRGWTDRVLSDRPGPEERRLPRWGPETPVLLPGWYDDWVLFERERLRHRMLCALERLSGIQLAAGRHVDAIEAALRAVELDPLRESAQRALIRAHLALGNVADAWRMYEAYRSVLDRELGVGPSPELRLLLADVSERHFGRSQARCPTCPLTHPARHNRAG